VPTIKLQDDHVGERRAPHTTTASNDPCMATNQQEGAFFRDILGLSFLSFCHSYSPEDKMSTLLLAIVACPKSSFRGVEWQKGW
jgi:hypothetical protein